MRSANIIRATVFAIAAAFLIFIQNHSVSVGTMVLHLTTAALTLGGLVILIKQKTNRLVVAVPTVVAATVFLLSLVFSGGGTAESRLGVFTFLVAFLAGATAIAELVFSFDAEAGDKLELRISSAIGLVAGFFFWLAPLDDLNAVGFFSAYLSVSAVQRALWAAAPNNRKKN